MTKYQVTFWYPAKYQRDIEANSPSEAFTKIQNKMFDSHVSEWELCEDEIDHEVMAYNDKDELIYEELNCCE